MINHPHRSKKAKAKTEAKSQPVEETVICVKGFDANLRCRDFQYEIGKSYEHPGKVTICPNEEQAARGEGGFHACEYPLDVFGYYPPAGNRFAVVEQSGDLQRHDEDTKIASAKITIQAELHIGEVIQRAIKWIFDRAKPEGASATGDQGAASATGDQGAASATGYQGAASATGDQGAASATGYQGAASATGDQGAASATGDRSAASATGYQGAASTTGYQGAAMASGYEGRAQAADGNAIFLVRRDDNYDITHAWAGIAGRGGIKPLVWYMLDADGKPIEC